jgi:hypothetical protein
MPDIPSNEPFRLRAGDTWKWNRDDLAPSYPAPTWALKYAFKNASSHFEIAAAANGTGFSVVHPMATTAAIVPGIYKWVAFVENGAERYQVDDGQLEVLPSFVGTNALDGRSHVKKTLDALEAMIEGKATKDQLEYTIGQRSIKRMEASEVIAWREKYLAWYRQELAEERVKNGYPSRNRIQMRFTKPR